MTDWVVFDRTNEELLASFDTAQKAKDQVAILHEWMDDFYRDHDEDPHEYELDAVDRFDRRVEKPVRVWRMKAGDRFAIDELWWPWNILTEAAEKVVAGEVVEWVPGMWRGTDNQAVEAAAFRAKETR